MRDRTTPRDVARPAVPDAEITTVRATEVADADARRCRVPGRVGVDDTQHQPDKPIGAVAAPAAVRSTSQHRIPGEEVLARRRQLHAPLKRSRPGQPKRVRSRDGRTRGADRREHQEERERSGGHPGLIRTGHATGSTGSEQLPKPAASLRWTRALFPP